MAGWDDAISDVYYAQLVEVSFLLVRERKFAGKSRSLGEKVVSLGEDPWLANRQAVMSDGTRIIPSEFKKIPDNVQAMVISEQGVTRLPG